MVREKDTPSTGVFINTEGKTISDEMNMNAEVFLQQHLTEVEIL